MEGREQAAIYTDDHAFEAEDKCIHCLLTGSQHRGTVARFRISTHDSGYYCVSIPNYEGGEVVVASEYDREHAQLVEQRDQLAVSLREMLSIVEDEGHADNYVPQVAAARNALATVEQGDEGLAKGGSG